MAAAALGAAVFVLRSPKLRRMAWQLARQYAAGPLAAWAATTVRDAWDQSADRPLADGRDTRRRPVRGDAAGRATAVGLQARMTP